MSVRVVGLFGGSFDPPHLAHLNVAQRALSDYGIDELWWMPVFRHPGGKRLAPYAHRVAMCRLVARELPRVHVSDLEQRIVTDVGRPARTIDVVDRLTELGCAVRLVLGSDTIASAPSWSDWARLTKAAAMIVIDRDPDGISATAVRARLATDQREHARQLLPRCVYDYIAANELYRRNPSSPSPAVEPTRRERLLR